MKKSESRPVETKIFYRVANIETNQGLWYDYSGNFTGLIHDKFDFCLNTKLPMPYNEKIIGYLSATATVEELFNWFTKEDITRLGQFGYYVMAYESSDYFFDNNHWVFRKDDSTLIGRVTNLKLD
jgi:hypothetical protein